MAIEGFCSVVEARELSVDTLMELGDILAEIYEARRQAGHRSR